MGSLRMKRTCDVVFALDRARRLEATSCWSDFKPCRPERSATGICPARDGWARSRRTPRMSAAPMPLQGVLSTRHGENSLDRHGTGQTTEILRLAPQSQPRAEGDRWHLQHGACFTRAPWPQREVSWLWGMHDPPTKYLWCVAEDARRSPVPGKKGPAGRRRTKSGDLSPFGAGQDYLPPILNCSPPA